MSIDLPRNETNQKTSGDQKTKNGVVVTVILFFVLGIGEIVSSLEYEVIEEIYDILLPSSQSVQKPASASTNAKKNQQGELKIKSKNKNLAEFAAIAKDIENERANGRLREGEKLSETSLTNGKSKLGSAKGVPSFKNGKQIGLILLGIVENDDFERAGLRNGDIIVSVNGLQLETFEEFSKLWMEKQHFKVELIRRRKTKDAKREKLIIEFDT